MKHALTMLAVLLVSACSGPFFYFPGGKLSGPEREIPEFYDIEDGTHFIELETLPSTEPYSVNRNGEFISGLIYIDPDLNAEKTWYANLFRDTMVRIKVSGDDNVCRAMDKKETDPTILEKFDLSGRAVYQLVRRH